MSNLQDSHAHDDAHAEFSAKKTAIIIASAITAFFGSIVLGCAFAPTIHF